MKTPVGAEAGTGIDPILFDGAGAGAAVSEDAGAGAGAGAGAAAAVPVVVEPDVAEGLPPLSPPPPPPPQAVSNAARATGPSWRVTECQEEFMNAPPYFLFGFCE